MELEGYQKSRIDPNAAIDIDIIMDETMELGPCRLTSPSWPYEIDLLVTPCICEDEGCQEKVVSVWRRNGLLSRHWLLSAEDLLTFETLHNFTDYVCSIGLFNSRGERLIVEVEYKQAFKKTYTEAAPMCSCASCAEHAGRAELSRLMQLNQMAMDLNDREELLDYVKESYGDEVEALIESAFETGYSFGRNFGEQIVKRNIEVDALMGQKYAEVKAKRAKASGDRSAQIRVERMVHLTQHMEKMSTTPYFSRLPREAIALAAYEIASEERPELWKQGKGQLDQYLIEIRRGEAGEELQRRYFALFPPKTA